MPGVRSLVPAQKMSLLKPGDLAKPTKQYLELVAKWDFGRLHLKRDTILEILATTKDDSHYICWCVVSQLSHWTGLTDQYWNVEYLELL